MLGSIEYWHPRWKEKARLAESIAELSGRSTYGPLGQYLLIGDAAYGLDIHREDDLLDIGCAAGFTGRFFAENLACYVGVDYNKGALERFGHKQLVHASATNLPFPDKSFSKSYMGSVLLCMSKDECQLALNEMRRVTKVRGYIADTLLQQGPEKNVTFFALTEFVSMLNVAGFSRVETRPMNPCLPHASIAIDTIVWP